MMRDIQILHPELLTLPERVSYVDSRRALTEVAEAWALLRRHGEHRFRESGWRDLGLGAVHVADPIFDVLGLEPAAAWATFDARDGWGQTVADIARRQRHWFTQPPRVLDALAVARAELWEVASNAAPRVVLRRVRDDVSATVHASLCDSAYPAGSLLVARLVRWKGLNIALCATAVGRRRAADLLRSGEPYALTKLAVERAASTVDEARACDVEAVWPRFGPRLMARLHRALEALEAQRAPLQHTDAEGRKISRASDRAIVADIAPGRRFRIDRVPTEEASPVDRELAWQSGLLQLGSIVSATPVFGHTPISRRELDSLIAACAAAAAHPPAQLAG